MNASLSNPNPGFTLIEVLVSLALCALLAVSTASAIAFASRAERIAARDGEASLMLQSLYAAQRLRPDQLLVVPHGWKVDSSTEIVKRPDEKFLSRFLLSVKLAGQPLPIFTLRILDDTP